MEVNSYDIIIIFIFVYTNTPHSHTHTHATDIRRPNSSSGAGAYYIRVFFTYLYISIENVCAGVRESTSSKKLSDWSAECGRATVADNRQLTGCDVQCECAGEVSARERGVDRRRKKWK